jgi:hypothetical protein
LILCNFDHNLIQTTVCRSEDLNLNTHHYHNLTGGIRHWVWKRARLDRAKRKYELINAESEINKSVLAIFPSKLLFLSFPQAFLRNSGGIHDRPASNGKETVYPLTTHFTPLTQRNLSQCKCIRSH